MNTYFCRTSARRLDEARRLLHGSRILNRVQHPRKQPSPPPSRASPARKPSSRKKSGSARVHFFFRPFHDSRPLACPGRRCVNNFVAGPLVTL